MGYAQLIDELLDLVREDAEQFGCVAEVEHARTILERGTSSHLQREVYRKALQSGASREEALKEVVDLLIEGTVEGLQSPCV